MLSDWTYKLLLVTTVWICQSECQRDDVEYFAPSTRPGASQDLTPGQGRSLGLALDKENIDKARTLFPLLYSSPSRIYVLVFNTTGIIRSRRIDNGWAGVDAWLHQQGLISQGPVSISNGYEAPRPDTRYRTDTRGGAAMYALLSLGQALPPSTPLVLVTSRPPSDTDLRYQALTALRDKQIQVHVYWTGKSTNSKYYLEEMALTTGGKFQERASEADVNSLKKVTLLVRDNLRGDSKNRIEVDSSLVDLILSIKGHVRSATLIPPRGYGLDGLDSSGNDISNKNISLSGKETGTWYLDIRAGDEPYSVTVEGTSHLALWARASNNSAEAKKKVVELWLEGNDVRRVDEVELVDSEGRQLAALGHRDTRSEDNTVSSTVELDTIATRQPAFLRLTATNNNGEQLTRLTRIPDEMRLPTSIEVGLGSTLTVAPGQRGTVYFNVANNRAQPMFYDFIITDRYNWIRYAQPLRSMINGISAEQVKVELQVPYSQQSDVQEPDIITMRAQLSTGESVTQRAYLRIGQTSYDSTSPSISYSYSGDCSNTNGPETCYIGTWGANVTIQDSGSGLLQITSKPVALQLDREFIAGTQDVINARFVATCCQTKVEVTATDTIGNKYSRVVDIERKWLTAGEIAAVVLGTILLILFIVIIIALICWCCRRNKRSLAIYPDH